MKQPGPSTGPEQGISVSEGDGVTGCGIEQGLGFVSSLAFVPWASGAERSYENICGDQDTARPYSSSVPRS